MLPFDDADAAPYLSPFSEEERDESWHLFLPDGRHMIKGEATIEVLSYLPAASWLSKLFRLLRITPLMGAFYWAVSKNRARLSRFMSGAPGPRRFP